MAASLGVSKVRVEFWTGHFEDITSAREAEESQLLKTVARKGLMMTEQPGENLECTDL
jgi:hypothetical protein